jgi:integrase
MASIVKRGNSWFAQVRKQGAEIQRKSFPRKKDAQEWAATVEAKIIDGTMPRKEAQRHTFGEMVDRYIEEIRPDKDCIRHLLWFKDQVGRRRLSNVTPADLNQLKTRLQTQVDRRGQQRSPGTVNRYLGSLSRAYSLATYEWEWLENTPMRRVRKLKEPRGRVRCLAKEELEAILNACRDDIDPLLYPFVVFALSTGARAGELQSLTWKDVDLKTGRGVLQKTKNGDRRAIAIRGHALEELIKLGKVRRIDSPWIFPSRDGAKPWNYRHGWYRAVDTSGVKDFRFHDLRHTAASNLAMNGASLPEIAGVLGHKSLAMVQRYAHLSDAHISGAVEAMNKKIFGK